MKKYLNLAAMLASALGAVMLSDVRPANASLIVDLRVGNKAATKSLTPGTDKTVTATNVGQTFQVSIYADVYGNDADGTNDGVQSLSGSLVNSGSGSVTTNANSATLAGNATFEASGYSPGVSFTTGANTNLGSPNGTSTQDNSNNLNYIDFRAANMEVNKTVTLQNSTRSTSSQVALPGRAISTTVGTGSEYFLGTATVSITALGTTTTLNWVPEMASDEPGGIFATSALWIEDAQVSLDSKGQPVYASNSTGPTATELYAAGTPITIVGAAATPEPASLGLLALGGLGLVARRRRKA